MSLDDYFYKSYDEANYNCAHLVCDIWQREIGQDISADLSGFLAPPDERRADWSLTRAFKPLSRPAAPCIVLMRRHRSPSHVGIYIYGNVAHIRPHGFAFQPLDVATLGYSIIRFYGYANGNHRP